MAQSFSIDPRLPIPDDMDLKSPSHPRNVTRNAIVVQNQASADTKYDPYPPPRVEEPFESGGVLSLFKYRVQPNKLITLLFFFLVFYGIAYVLFGKKEKQLRFWIPLAATFVVAMLLLK
jgi:hypothetical protein